MTGENFKRFIGNSNAKKKEFQDKLNVVCNELYEYTHINNMDKFDFNVMNKIIDRKNRLEYLIENMA